MVFFTGMFGGAGDFYKIDENGNIEQHLPLTGQGNDIETGNDGCYLLGGSISPPEDFKEFMYLAKIGDLIDSDEAILNKKTAKIFPNPATHYLQIQLSDQQNDLIFGLFDPLGRQIKIINIQSESTKISVHDLSNGIYFFTLKKDHKILQKGKIIFKH